MPGRLNPKTELIHFNPENELKTEDYFNQIVKSARNKAAYFAEQFNNAMKGAGTKDDDLIRLLVCRAEVFKLYIF